MNYFLLAMKRYADFTGRSRRKEYWYFTLFQVLFSLLAMMLDGMMGFTFGILPYGMIYLVFILATFIPSLAVTVRRLHDIGRSGWWWFIIFIPFVGAVILLVFMFLDSVPGPNKWGPNPKSENENLPGEALDSHLAR